MKRRSIGLFALGLMAVLICTAAAPAASIMLNFNPGQAGNQGFGGELGNDFTVNVPVEVTHVGVFDDLSNGIAGSLTAQIWTRSGNTGTLVPGTTMTFTNADPGTLDSAVRLKTLPTPVILQPGTYTVASNSHSATDMNLNSNVGGFGFTKDDGGGLITIPAGPGVQAKRWGLNPNSFPNNADGDWLMGSGTFAFEPTFDFMPAYAVSAGTVGNQNFGGSLGMDFDTNGPVEITHLGVFDSASDGINGTITARLYARHPSDNTGAELATLSFTGGGDVLIGGNRYRELATPLLLPGGFQGTIVGEGYNAAELVGNAGAPTPWQTHDGNGTLSFVGTSRWGATAGQFPATPDGGPANRYAAGTFVFAPAEVSTATVTKLNVANGSFEEPAHAAPGGWTNSVPGWTTNNSGNFNPPAGIFTDPIPDGNQVGFVNVGGTMVSDPLPGPGLEADTLYVLDVAWGHRVGSSTPAHSMNLVAGSQPLGWLNDTNMRKGPPVGPGQFEANRLYATTNHNAALGSPLSINLTGGGTGQAVYDDVQVTKISGAAVLVNNPSFEMDDIASATNPTVWKMGAIGWVPGGTANAGIFEDASQITPADGSQSAFVERGASLTQTLTGVTLQPDYHYVLLAEVADRTSTPFAGYQVELLAGGEVLAADLDTLDVIENQAFFYVTSAVEFTTGGSHPLLGEDLGIRLSTPPGTTYGQAYFDNVRLFAFQAVPEPSTFVLGLLAIAAMAGYRLRRKQG